MHIAPSFKTGLMIGLAGTAAIFTLMVMRRMLAQAADPGLDDLAYEDPVDEATAESFPASDPPARVATVGATPKGVTAD